jgi:hypothetical protein
MIFGGQYLSDSPLITDILASHFSVEHTTDEIDETTWTQSIMSWPTDEVFFDLELYCYFTGHTGLIGSAGVCSPIGDAVEALHYEEEPDSVCAVRYDSGTYKTLFIEFSLANIIDRHPSSETNHGLFQLLHRTLTWFGHEFTGVEDDQVLIPEELSAPRAYPNPFNSSVDIEFDLPKSQNITINIYSRQGKLIDSRESYFRAGTHISKWSPSAERPSGLYIYKISGENYNSNGKMLYIK